MKYKVFCPFLVALVFLFFSCGKQTKSQQQDQPVTTYKDTSYFERFSGKFQLQKNLKEGGARIVVWNQIFTGHQRIEKLQTPFQGLLIVQLRGGELTTSIGGERRERRAGEFWTVPAGAVMGLETEDDAAILQVIDIEEDSIPKPLVPKQSKPYQEQVAPPDVYQSFVAGALKRETYQVDAPSAYSVVIWDLMFAAGQRTEKITFPGAAVLEVRSGAGQFLIDGKGSDIKIGSTLQMSEGSTLEADNRQGTEPVTARAIIIRSASR